MAEIIEVIENQRILIGSKSCLERRELLFYPMFCTVYLTQSGGKLEREESAYNAAQLQLRLPETRMNF